nr:HAMP domain-containing sensor histidine kinase [Scopulibacillus daqui]
MESVSHLAAGFAHELRNPLSVIRGFIQLSGLTNNIEKYYKTILSEIDRMNEIIEDFLSLSRNNSRKQVQEPNELFHSLIPLIRSECILRNITFDYQFEKTNRRIYFDKSMIKQIILNLLRNAVEAFEEKQNDKRFEIRTKALKDVYQVTVSDNGPGMEKSVLEKLGKPFFTTKENGTGIGLPLCKKIIKDHEGEFYIDSKLGEGTTITFTLPFVND